MSVSVITVEIGNTLTLKCSYVGNPIPSATWLFNGLSKFLTVSDVSIATSQGVSSSTSTLTWTNVPYRAHGHYHCNVSSISGQARKTFFVDITSKYILH